MKNQYPYNKGILFHLSTECDMSETMDINHTGENRVYIINEHCGPQSIEQSV